MRVPRGLVPEEGMRMRAVAGGTSNAWMYAALGPWRSIVYRQGRLTWRVVALADEIGCAHRGGSRGVHGRGWCWQG